MLLRNLLLIVHILSVMLAFGASTSLGFWAASLRGNPAHARFVLLNLQRIDRILIDPGYTIAGLTGMALVHVTGQAWSTPYILTSFILWFLAFGVTHGMLRPAVRRQLAALDDVGMESPDFHAAEARARLAGMILTAMVITLVTLMVWKPSGL